MAQSPSTARKPTAREKLLDAAIVLIRQSGFAATSVEDLCKAAGVTKGAFFHHFASKDALGAAAARHWGETTSGLFASAPYHDPADPLDRVLAYIDFRRELIAGAIPEYTCYAGTLVQEAYGTSPDIRDACASAIFEHAKTLEADISEAAKRYGVEVDRKSVV